MTRLCTPAVFALLSAVALVACGPTPPNFDALARHRVEACGTMFSADEVVRRAYDGEPTGALPSSVYTPPDTVAVSYLDLSGIDTLRHYPCAEDTSHAREILGELGYRNPILTYENEQALFYEAIDKYGIAATYSIFFCDFVGDVLGRRSGSLYHQGLFGKFGENGEGLEQERLLRKLASFTYTTGMTLLADEGLPRLVERVTLLGSEQEVGEVSHPSNEGHAAGIGVCVTWVEPNLWGGCDAVRVGISQTVATDEESGEFHQLAIHSLLEGFYGYAGWCGRRE